MFGTTPATFHAVRFILGVFEAGFHPHAFRRGMPMPCTLRRRATYRGSWLAR
ncbi:MAG: hypothetical protein ABI327_04690 [Burkholderiaceae bacterium]